MAAVANSPTGCLSDAELRHDGHDLIAELWKAVDAAATGSANVRAAVSTVLGSLLDEAGPGSPYALTLQAVIDALAVASPQGASHHRSQTDAAGGGTPAAAPGPSTPAVLTTVANRRPRARRRLASVWVGAVG